MKRAFTLFCVWQRPSSTAVQLPRHPANLTTWKRLPPITSCSSSRNHLCRQGSLWRKISTPAGDGNKSSIWQTYFGNDGLESIYLSYKSARSGNLADGDNVLIVDNTAPRNSWVLGKVIEAVTDKHGLVHQVHMKTKTSMLDRPMTKVCLLHEAQWGSGKDCAPTACFVLVTSGTR